MAERLFDDEERYGDDEVERVYQLRKESANTQSKWREEAREAYEFRDGDQWSQEDRALLEEQQRPAVTFNRIAPIIDSILGHEMDNRQEIRFIPRGVGDGKPNEVFTAAAQWVYDLCDAEDEESDAYGDALTCGLGALETRVDFTLQPEGQIVRERVSPLEFRWDPNARKHNIIDARWVIREKWVPMEEIKERFPEKASQIDTTRDTLVEREWVDEHDATQAWKYEQDQNWYSSKDDKALLIHFQERVLEKSYRVQDPESNEIHTFSESKFNKLRKVFEDAGVDYVQVQEWAYKQKFIVGDICLKEGLCPVDDSFSYHFITGKRDEQHSYWYGLIRVMRDPQEWANKFFSQSMYILNSNAKGGVMAENNAVEDKREFEENWASSDSVSWVEDGALTTGRIKQKDFGGYPTGLDKLMTFAISSIRDCSGVNLEMLGMANRDQAGILEQERKKAALVVLKPVMNSLRRARKIGGRSLLAFMRRYIPEGTIVRITDEQQLRFYKDDDTLKYDVIIDTAPTSPNLKSEIWAILGNLIPAMVKAGVPLPPDLIKFSPLPESVAVEWVSYIEKQTQSASPEEMKKLRDMLQKLQQENAGLKSKEGQFMAEMQHKKELHMMEMFAEREKLLLDQKAKDQELVSKQKMSDADRAMKLIEIQTKYDLEIEKLEKQCETEREMAQAKMALDSLSNEQKIEADKQNHVISIEAEREKRMAASEADSEKIVKAVKKHENETKYAEKIDETKSEIAELATKMKRSEEAADQRRAVILEYLKAQGGEIKDLAERLA
jgi:hypothetical protein